MTDTNPIYRKLTKHLNKTRKSIVDVCRDLGIDLDDVEDYYLDKHIMQCSHCDIWGTDHIADLDENPICLVCERIVGR